MILNIQPISREREALVLIRDQSGPLLRAIVCAYGVALSFVWLGGNRGQTSAILDLAVDSRTH